MIYNALWCVRNRLDRGFHAGRIRWKSALQGFSVEHLASVVLLAAPSALGQDNAGGNGITEAENRTIYDAVYFSQYNVVTARDQLERIPGLQNLVGGGGGGDQRGFGNSGDQVLINGERISGKSNDIASVLGRIQARQVLRIEVIHGPEAGLDVRGQGPFANVVVDGAMDSGYGSWKAEWNHYADGFDQYALGLNYTGNMGAFKYVLSAEVDPSARRTETSEVSSSGDGTPFERKAEVRQEDNEDYLFIANTGYSFESGDMLNVNALYERQDSVRGDLSARFAIHGQEELFTRHVLIKREEGGDSWEVGGDFSRQLANGNQWKLLFVFANSSTEGVNRFTTVPSGESAVIGRIQEEAREDSETILRTTYGWGTTATSSFESGVEVAFNSLTRGVRLFEDDGGELIETSLFNQGSVVEEDRLEAFTSYSKALRSDLFLEASFDVEFSDISQTGGDVGLSRDFFFTRPRAVLRYDMTDSKQLSVRVERIVGQLDFGDFVSSFSRDNNRAGVVNAGNPELEPEKAWEYELSYQHRFADDLGRITVTGLYEDIEDQIASAPLFVTDDAGIVELRTATGNIGDGQRTSLTVDGSLRLSPSFTLDGEVVANRSRVTDPFTGEERDFHNVPDFEWSLGFRHDISWNNLTYGMTAEQRGPRVRSDLDYEQWQESDPDLEIFAELQPSPSTTLRLEAKDVLSAENRRERLQYDGNRSDGLVVRSEQNSYSVVRSIIFSIQSVF